MIILNINGSKKTVFAYRGFEAKNAGLSRARGHLLVGGAEDAAV
eukprot:COSAG06_NODE_18734_length_871_cov_1.498705_1_plen_43_part_10